MPHSARSSNASASCRLEWRPSRWLWAALLAVGPLAAGSILASEMPRTLAFPLSLAALAHGGLLARRYRREPRRWFVIRRNPPGLSVDGVPARDAFLQWRGPMAFLSWRDGEGRVRRCSWWPDTLPPALRRELRLAAPDARAARAAPSVAP